MKLWDDLVGVAMVGTERRTFDLTELRALADDTLPAVPEAEAQVLAAAVVLDNYRRAGRRPAKGTVPEPAPSHDRPACSDTAAQVLDLLLGGMVAVAGGTTALIEAWLTTCRAAGRRPPDRLLAPLLDLATASPPLRPAVAGAVGRRGEWLAGANPDWAWAAVPPAATTAADYPTASTAERVALLTSLREQDRPAAARLLRSTWKAEPAAERSALLAALEPALADDDEPFLEELLDDRAASVRAAAAQLLNRLPRSRRAARMADRARPLVRVEGRFRRKLVVSLPDSLDAAARRDGITDARDPGSGLHAAWLSKIVAATPLDVWEPHLGMAPDEAVAKATEESMEVRNGWISAALAQRDERWALALLGHQANAVLVSALSPEAARRYAADALGRSAPPDTHFLAALAAPGPWDATLSALAVEKARGVTGNPMLSTVVGRLAWRLDPIVLPAVEAWIEQLGQEGSRREVRALAHALSIRATIAEEFS
ncbi:MAG: DUF5691 domain-containing protein [Acidimicrobiia bacterium]